MADRSRWKLGSLLIEGGVTMSTTPGIVPDHGRMIQPYNDTQPSSTIGDLILEWGNTGAWTEVRRWNDVLITEVQQVREPYRDTVYRIEDRRWKWKHVFIHGNYNVKDEAGNTISGTGKTPRELATLLLTELGETGYNVDALPTDANLSPTCNWFYSSAAVELQKLCVYFGAEVHLLANNTIKLIIVGTGALPPSTNLIDPVVTGFDITPRPESIRAYAADTLFDSWLELEPCMPEIGGSTDDDSDVVHIDNISFKPTAGWETCDIENFMAVQLKTAVDASQTIATASDATKRLMKKRVEHCKRYLWKMFRIKRFAGGATKPPGYRTDVDSESDPWPDVTDMRLLLPLETTRLQTGLDEFGKQRKLPAELAGSFREHERTGDSNTSRLTIWSYGFRIDTKNGYIYTNRPCYRLTPIVHEFADNAAMLAGTGYTYTQEDLDCKNVFKVSDADALYKGLWRITDLSPLTFTAANEVSYGFYPPILKLRTAYGLKQTVYGPRYHQAFTKAITGATTGAGMESIARTNIRRTVIESYTSDYYDLATVGSPFDSKTTVDTRLESEIDEYKRKYDTTIDPQSGRYSVPYSQNTDGIVRQVSWSSGPEEDFVQVVSVGFEHDYGQKPALQKAKEALRESQDRTAIANFSLQQNRFVDWDSDPRSNMIAEA